MRREFAEQLVRNHGLPRHGRTEIEEDDVTVHIEGENLGVLVGPERRHPPGARGGRAGGRAASAGGHSAWVHVDVGGYRERRREALAAFAREQANEVIEAGEARSLEPMSAADRKVVHDAVAEIEGVATISEGEEPRRRVVIRPA